MRWIGFGLLAGILAACSGLDKPVQPETKSYIVVLKSSALSVQSDIFAQKIEGLSKTYSLSIAPEDQLSALGMVVLENITPELATAIARDAQVASVSEDAEVTADAQTLSWGYTRIGGALATSKGKGTLIYLLDSGISMGHEDLGNLKEGKAFVKCKDSATKVCLDEYDDDYGHGSHVAGIAGATNNDLGSLGVAYKAKLVAVKVLNSVGKGKVSKIIKGIDWVIQQDTDKPKVINMSLGTPGTDDSPGAYCPAERSSDALHAAIQEAVCDHKITVIASAGNLGQDAADQLPAAFDEVITVSATKDGDDFAAFSNYGADVDLAAPGDRIYSAWNPGTTHSYATASGTSMAAPHVAGAAALILEQNPTFTPAQVKAALLASAESTSGWSNTSGHPHAEPFLNITGF